MKKSIDFKLGGRDSEMFFRPIRKKEDYLNLLFNSMKLMYVAEPSGSATISPSMQLCVDKSSRLLFSSQDKIFSVSFPFLVELGDTHKIKFYSSTYGEITSVTISDTLSLLNSDSFRNSSDIEDLDAALCELVSYSRPGYWSFLKELFFLESGYLRFDHDPIHANGYIHPLFHIDVFYSSRATFKIGLSTRITHQDLLDILNPKTNCHFLNKKL